ncbi:Endonuclease/exonuclease/phosphatase,Reverse transcriptase domain [Cinara cedri]|uniref:Endonuclease/exonuclease/phosphatase,Reverse transcriptase domain n=1 Tax=Cinara cedri TaxID=506608 RepID=A0A5E4MCZ6_9HEMI|nr:Endonuclease/exonuclease/phosphatase,Reverse transcriptase domain [Cinara cedri]
MHQVEDDLEVTGADILGNISTGRGRSKASQVVIKRNPCKNLGTWNVRTMLNASKLENIKLEIMRLDIDILGVSEVRWSGNGDFWSDDYRVIYSGDETPGRAGVGFIINKKWGHQIVSKITYKDRLILIKLRAKPNDIVLIQVYFPTSDAEDDAIEEVYSGLEELCKLAKGEDNLIIMGDWNALVGEGAEGQELIPSDSTVDKWKKIKDAIHNAASNTLKRNSPEPRKPWINNNIIRDIEERRKYKNAMDNHGIRRYKELKKKINREAKFAREKWLEGKCQEVEQLLRNNRLDQAFNIIKKFFRGKKKLNRRIRDIDGNLILDNDKITTRWKKYLEALYQEGEAANLNNNNNPDMQGEEILRGEFSRSLKLMKTGKAAGTDDIAMELIQNASTELQDELFKLSIVEKELSNDQFGFRRNKGTREAILSLRLLIEKQIEFNKDTFIAFIDLEKAFDKVPWKGLFYTLEGIGADYKDRRIIYNLYKDQSAIIKVTDKTETAIIRKGVRQGCPLSPALFKISVKQPIKEIRETLFRNKIGIKVGREIISFLRFADDIALLATNEHDLERALEEMSRCFQKYQLIINWQKTKVMMLLKL